MFAKVTRQRLLTPNYIVVQSDPDDDDSYSGSAEATESSDITDMEKREHYWLFLTSNAQATSLAKAILQSYQLQAQDGSASMPLHVGLEVYDYVNV